MNYIRNQSFTRSGWRAGKSLQLFLPALSTLICALIVSQPGDAWARTNEVSAGAMLGRSVKSSTIENYTLWDIVQRAIKDLHVPLCVDYLPIRRGDQEPRYTFQFEEGSFKKYLDRLIQEDPRYIWVEQNGVINVLRSDKKDDPSYPLNTALGDLSIIDVTVADLLCQLPQDLGACTRAKLYIHPEFPDVERQQLYNKVVSIDIVNATPQDVLNEICRQIKCAWVLSGPDDASRVFTLLKLPASHDLEESGPGAE